MNNFSENNCETAPGLAIHGAGSAVVKTANTTFFKVNGRQMYFVAADMPSLALATTIAPGVNGTAGGSPAITGNQLTFGGATSPVSGNLAFDNGTVPVTTNSCRLYTLCADSAQTEAGTVSLYWLAGQDFPKHRQAQDSDIARTPLSTSVEVGYVFVKNETSSVFTPNTTALDTGSLTVIYRDNYAQSGK